MAQRHHRGHGHGTGASVTRRCPDKEMLGRYSFQLPDLPGGLWPLRDKDTADDD
jgi:hypothetical protein